MVKTRGSLLRLAAVLTCATGLGLVGCSQPPDLLLRLKADKPQDPRANQACRSDRLAKHYVMAASDSTVSEVRPYAGEASVILDGRPNDQYVALCLLDIPAVASGAPSGTGPLTLAVLTDGGSLWLSTPP